MATKTGILALAIAILLGVIAPARAADRIRIAIQKTGTVAWEIETMKALGLDKAANLDVETIELATTDAGKIALRGGAADVIVSDWLWAMRERSLGDNLLFSPYSTSLGAIVTQKNSPIRSLADLSGHSLGVAGGPLDKSWLMVRAAALKEGTDLAKSVHLAYGAPPLLAEKLAEGELDASLEYWPYVIDLEKRGFPVAVEMTDVEKALGAKGPVAMVGYVFSEAFAKDHVDVLRRYFTAADKAREALARDPALWAPIKARLHLTDESALEAYRARYLAGVPKRPVSEEAKDAEALYRAIAAVGGTDLVGDAKELDPTLFFDPNAAAR